MNFSKNLCSRRIVLTLFVAALLCRGQWLGQQLIHETAVPTSVQSLQMLDTHFMEHDGHLMDFLNHHHSEDTKVSDITHAALHGLGMMDSPLHGVTVVLPATVKAEPVFFFTASLQEAPPRQLFRPPRFA